MLHLQLRLQLQLLHQSEPDEKPHLIYSYLNKKIIIILNSCLRYLKKLQLQVGQDNHSSLSGLSGAVVSGTVRRPQSTILTCFDGDPLLFPHLAYAVSIILFY